MSRYPEQQERGVRLQRLVEDWTHSGFLDATQRARLLADVQIDLRRTNRFLRFTLMGFGLLIVLASVYLDISQRYSSLRDGIRENAMWSVYQLDREARRLSETATIALAKNDLGEAQMKALSLRYDILYSRMTMFEKAKFEETFTIDAAVEAHLATLQRIIYDNTGIFDDIAAGKPISHASLTTLSFEFEELTRTTDDLLGYVNTVLSTGRADTRDAVMALERKSGSVSYTHLRAPRD